jgi:hypothetical protein
LRTDCFPDTVVRVQVLSFFGFYLWSTSDPIRATPTIITKYNYSPIFAFPDADYLLAANPGRFETVAAGSVE